MTAKQAGVGPVRQRTKRQHFVPRSYLDRFAVGGNVLVRRRDGAVFESDTINVAVEAGMYDVPTPSGISTAIEDALAVVDGAAVNAMRAIDESARPPAAGSEQRYTLSVYLALLMTRSPEARERAGFPARVVEFLGGRALTRELVAEYLEKVHLREKPRDAEVEGAHTLVSVAMQDPETLTRAATMDLMLGSVSELRPAVDAMNWAIEFDRKGRLMTSDSPVVLWRAPTRRDAFEGVGVNNAEEVRFPLDPTKILVLSQRSGATTSRMSGERARAVNADTAVACHNFVVGRLDRRAAIERLRIGDHRPVMRFNVAPGFQREADGTVTKTDSEIVHFWIPRRDQTQMPPPVRPRRRR